MSARRTRRPDVGPDDFEVISACLRAAVEGPFFPDWEFQTLFGLERDEVAQVLAELPDSADTYNGRLAINNSLNMLLGYPHRRWDVWAEFIPVPPDAVAAVYERWGGDTAADPDRRGFFGRLM